MKSVSGFTGTHTCCWSRHTVAIDYWSRARREVPPTVEIISERFGRSVMDQPTDASVLEPNPCRGRAGCYPVSAPTAQRNEPRLVTVTLAEWTDPRQRERRVGVSGRRRLEPADAASLFDLTSRNPGEPVNYRPFTRPLGSTSCGNRPVRRAKTHHHERRS